MARQPGSASTEPKRPPAGVILSAGQSSRMGSPKALLPYRGATFLEHLVSLLLGRVEPLLVVLGHEADHIREAVHLPPQARVLLNPNYRMGQLSSLQTAIRALEGNAVSGLLVVPVDHPAVEPAVVAALLETFAAEQPEVLMPTFDGRRGHPVIFSARLFAELLAAPMEEGARAVVRRHAARELPVNDAGILANIDDPESYRRLVGGSLLSGSKCC